MGSSGYLSELLRRLTTSGPCLVSRTGDKEMELEQNDYVFEGRPEAAIFKIWGCVTPVADYRLPPAVGMPFPASGETGFHPQLSCR